MVGYGWLPNLNVHIYAIAIHRSTNYNSKNDDGEGLLNCAILNDLMLSLIIP